jgi:uncharacterized membrane protein YbhN (UPF0104 family)
VQSLNLKTCLSRFRSAYLLLAVAFVIFIAWQNLPDFQIVLAHLQGISLEVLLYSLMLALVSYGFRSLRWLGYLRLVETRASTKRHILIYLSGFAFTASPGKVGELMRGTHLSHLGITFKYTLCSFISERLLDVIVVLMLGTYFLIRQVSSTFILFFLFMAILPLVTPLAFKLLLKVINSERLLSLIKILSSLWQTKLTAKSTLLTLLAWSFQGLILYFLLLEFGFEITIAMAISIYCLSLLIGAASLIPGGIGVTELGMIWLLTQIGVNNEIAFSASLLARMLTLWPAMAIGVISSFFLQYKLTAKA